MLNASLKHKSLIRISSCFSVRLFCEGSKTKKEVKQVSVKDVYKKSAEASVLLQMSLLKEHILAALLRGCVVKSLLFEKILEYKIRRFVSA